jgi:hypothetical protein
MACGLGFHQRGKHDRKRTTGATPCRTHFGRCSGPCRKSFAGDSLRSVDAAPFGTNKPWPIRVRHRGNPDLCIHPLGVSSLMTVPTGRGRRFAGLVQRRRPPPARHSIGNAITHHLRGAGRGGWRVPGVFASLDPRLISVTPTGVDVRPWPPGAQDVAGARTSVSASWDGFPNLSPLRAQPKTAVDRDEHQRHGSAAAWPGQIFKFVPRGRGPLCPPAGCPTAKPRPMGRQTRRSVGLRPACLSNQLPPTPSCSKHEKPSSVPRPPQPRHPQGG